MRIKNLLTFQKYLWLALLAGGLGIGRGGAIAATRDQEYIEQGNRYPFLHLSMQVRGFYMPGKDEAQDRTQEILRFGNYLLDRFVAYAQENPRPLAGIKWQIFQGPAGEKMLGPSNFTDLFKTPQLARRFVVFEPDPAFPSGQNPLHDFLQKELATRQIKLVFDPQHPFFERPNFHQQEIFYFPQFLDPSALILVSVPYLTSLLRETDPAKLKAIVKPELIKHDLLHTDALDFPRGGANRFFVTTDPATKIVSYELYNRTWFNYAWDVRMVDHVLAMLSPDFAQEAVEVCQGQVKAFKGKSKEKHALYDTCLANFYMVYLTVLFKEEVTALDQDNQLLKVLYRLDDHYLKKQDLSYRYDAKFQKIKLILPGTAPDAERPSGAVDVYWPIGLLKVGSLEFATEINPPRNFRSAYNQALVEEFLKTAVGAKREENIAFDKVHHWLKSAKNVYDYRYLHAKQKPSQAYAEDVAKIKNALERIKGRLLSDLATRGLQEDANGRFYIDPAYLAEEQRILQQYVENYHRDELRLGGLLNLPKELEKWFSNFKLNFDDFLTVAILLIFAMSSYYAWHKKKVKAKEEGRRPWKDHDSDSR